MTIGSGVRRREGGGVTVRLTSRERDVLATLPDQLAPVLRGEGGPPDLYDRIFPRAYDDPELDEEFRGLMHDSLLSERLDALETFLRTLDRGQSKRLTYRVDLDDEEASAWLSVVNDARLVLASLLGIRDESHWDRAPDESSPAGVVLWYLGWLEEQFVTALMGTFDEPPPPNA